MKRYVIGTIILRIIFIGVIVGSIVMMRASQDDSYIIPKKNGVMSLQEQEKRREEVRRTLALLRPYGVATVEGISQAGIPKSQRGLCNQDRAKCFTLAGSGDSFFIVADGHGDYGHLVADAITHKEGLARDEHNGDFEQAFQAMQKKLAGSKAAQESGAAVVCAHLTKNKEATYVLRIAHAGDSRAILIGSDGAVLFETHDHKPNDPDEAERIKKVGGQVVLTTFIDNEERTLMTLDYWNSLPVNGRPQPLEEWIVGDKQYDISIWRVNWLAMSRALGDLNLAPAVTCLPTVTEIPVTQKHAFLIMASDGVWDVFSNEKAAQIVRAAKSSFEAAESLVVKAREEGSTDDITALVVDLTRMTDNVKKEAAEKSQQEKTPDKT